MLLSIYKQHVTSQAIRLEDEDLEPTVVLDEEEEEEKEKSSSEDSEDESLYSFVSAPYA